MTKTKLISSLSSAVAASLLAAPIVQASENPFSMQKISNPTQLAEMGKDGEGKCGDKTKEGACSGKMDKSKDGKCGEGKCGDNSKEKMEKSEDGKCGDKAKEKMDKSKDGKCGEGKCGDNSKGKTEKTKDAQCGDKMKEGGCSGKMDTPEG